MITWSSPDGDKDLVISKDGMIRFLKSGERILKLDTNKFIRIGTDEDDNVYIESLKEETPDTSPISHLTRSYAYIYLQLHRRNLPLPKIEDETLKVRLVPVRGTLCKFEILK